MCDSGFYVLLYCKWQRIQKFYIFWNLIFMSLYQVRFFMKTEVVSSEGEGPECKDLQTKFSPLFPSIPFLLKKMPETPLHIQNKILQYQSFTVTDILWNVEELTLLIRIKLNTVFDDRIIQHQQELKWWFRRKSRGKQKLKKKNSCEF